MLDEREERETIEIITMTTMSTGFDAMMSESWISEAYSIPNLLPNDQSRSSRPQALTTHWVDSFTFIP